MSTRNVILGMGLTDGYGNLHGAWRAPGVNPGNYADIDASIRYAQAAERGLFTFLFTPDFPGVRGDVERTTISNVLDPIVSLTAIARATERIGFVATGSTTFQEPFNLARQFKALDVISHGRAGWNAVTTSDPTVAANYGRAVAERAERYARAHEAIQITQALWGAGKRAPGSRTSPGTASSIRRSCGRSTCRANMSHLVGRSRSLLPSRASP